MGREAVFVEDAGLVKAKSPVHVVHQVVQVRLHRVGAAPVPFRRATQRNGDRDNRQQAQETVSRLLEKAEEEIPDTPERDGPNNPTPTTQPSPG